MTYSGQDVILSIKTSSTAPISHQWFRNEDFIPTNDKRIISSFDNGTYTLTIKNTNKNDSASYSFVIFDPNNDDILISTTYLFVNENIKETDSSKETVDTKTSEFIESDSIEILKPSFLQKPKSVIDVDEGSKLIIEAKLIASPKPETVWLLNNKQIKANEQGISLMSQSDVHMHIYRLEINKCKSSQHTGLFKLVVENAGGQSTCTTQVNVKETKATKVEVEAPKEKEPVSEEAPKEVAKVDQKIVVSDIKKEQLVSNSPPVLLERTEFVKAIEGQTIEFLSVIHSDEQPTTKWTYSNKVIRNSETYAIVSKNNNHSLQIKNVTLAMKGKYLLEVTNKFGNLTCEFQLDVLSEYSKLYCLNFRDL